VRLARPAGDTAAELVWTQLAPGSP